MEPFRAFVGDQLRKDQHTVGYAVQTAFIGAGAVIGSIFPYLLEHWGVSNVAPDGSIPETVRWSFWAGGAALFVAVAWTVLTTREYSPDELRSFGEEDVHGGDTIRALASRNYATCFGWAAAGLAILVSVREFALRNEVYLLGALLIGYGLLSAIAISAAKKGRGAGILGSIVGDFSGMPTVMKQLALVQFFSWSALFIMWINTTPVVARDFFGAADPASAAYQDAGNWVGVLFAVYNGVAAIAALVLLPLLAKKIGKARTHAICLLAGAMGYASFFLLRDPQHLLLAEIGIGIAWASILAMPYAILASSLPQAKLGTYMGLFNVFIVIPQLLVATVMGSIMQAFFPDEPIWTMAFAAGVMTLAALATLRVREA
jgi:maltose/moltooligosaccharide transporter